MRSVLLAVLLLASGLAGCLGTVDGPADMARDSDRALTPIDRSIEGLGDSQPTQRVDLADGDTFELTAQAVKHDPGTGQPIRAMAYNGMIPGPELHLTEGASVETVFTNELEEPTTVHWHGLRHDNEADGVPGLTQDPVEPGETFTYEIEVPDAGVFWYHPHVRTDVQKELGLYGALIVEPPKEPTETYPEEDVLMLDDIRLMDGDVPHMYEETVTFADSGRWGNQVFVNGSGTAEQVEIPPHQRHRLHLVNPSNARTWRLSFLGFESVEKIGTGASYLEQPREIDSLRLGPAERAIVDVELPTTGQARIVDEPTAWTLAEVHPGASSASLGGLAAHEAPSGPHERARAEDRSSILEAEPDHEVHLRMLRNTSAGMGDANASHGAGDHAHADSPDPAQGVVNPFPSSRDLEWSLVDVDTNETQPRYSFQVGDVVQLKVDIVHDHGGGGAHGGHTPVPHPIHLHGQRLIVESYGDQETDELAWKDTFLANDPVRDYQQATVRVELTEPGTWLIHCHVTEHAEAGMTAVMDVQPAGG